MINYKRYFLYLTLVILFTKVIIAYAANLIPQEAYYWTWSNHIDLSYYDHPPMAAYLIKLSVLLGGDKGIYVRLPSIISSLIVSIIIYRLALKMYNPMIGFFSSFIFSTSIIFYSKGIIMDPDSPLILFWTLTLFFVYKATIEGINRYWYYSGVSLGLGLLSKYTMIVIILSTLLFLLWDSNLRKWLKKKEPYLALIIALIIFSPVIVWNMQNNWTSFFFQSGERLKHININPIYTLGFIGSQSGIISPILFSCIILSFIKSYKRKSILLNIKYKFLFCYSVPVFSLFLILSPVYWVKVNWPICAYITAIIFVTAFCLEYSKDYIYFFRRSWQLSLFSTIILYLITLSPYPLLSGELNTYDGWDEIGKKVNTAKDELSLAGKTFVFAYNFKVASQLSFYSSDKYPVYSTNLFGLNARAINYWIKPNELKGQHGIFVYDNNFDPDYKEHLNRLINQFCDLAVREEPLQVFKMGRLIRDLTIFKCFYYHGY